jgi:hypothetical protein
MKKFENQYLIYVQKASNMLQRLLPPKSEGNGGNGSNGSQEGGDNGGNGDNGDNGDNGEGEKQSEEKQEDISSLKEFERLRLFLRDGIGNGGWPGLGFDIGAVGTSEIQQGFLRCMLAFASIPRREFSDVKDALHEGEYSKAKYFKSEGERASRI